MKLITKKTGVFLIQVAVYVGKTKLYWSSHKLVKCILDSPGHDDKKKEKDLPCAVDNIMSSLRSTLRDLLAVYKTLIVLITPLILIVVPLSWNTTVSGNKSHVIYRSLGKFRSHLDATFVFFILLGIFCLSYFDALIKKPHRTFSLLFRALS